MGVKMALTGAETSDAGWPRPLRSAYRDGDRGGSRVRGCANAAGPRSTSPRSGVSALPSSLLRPILATRGGRSLLSLVGLALVTLGLIHPTTFDSPTLRSAVGATSTLLAAIAASCSAIEFLHTRRVRTLLLWAALLILAETGFIGDLLPAILHLSSASNLTSVLPMGQLLAAGALAAAALTPSDRLAIGRWRPLVDVAFFSLLAAGLAATFGLALRRQLFSANLHHRTVLSAAPEHPLRTLAVLLTTALLVCACLRFARTSRREASPVLSLLAGAALVLTGASLYDLALPWDSPTALTPQDILRLVAFSLVCAAAARAEGELRRTSMRAAALAERARVAQDLHDGLAQDLALIAAHGATLSGELGHQHPMVLAARRALSLSRGTIVELSDTSASSSEEALQALAAELHARFQISIAVDVQPEAETDSMARDSLTRIAREAIANAARHGRARNVLVSLRRTPGGIALRIRDDGCGLACTSEARPGEGFGLAHMRERTALLGGSFVVRSPRSGGTELEITLP